MSYLVTLDKLRANCHTEHRRPIFGAKLNALRLKMFHIFNFLQSAMVFEIVNPFSCIFKAISSERRYLIFSVFPAFVILDVRTVKFFPLAAQLT